MDALREASVADDGQKAVLAVSAEGVAEMLEISRSQVWKLHSAGRLPLPVRLGRKTPRWLLDELREWLRAGCPNRLTWQKMRKERLSRPAA